MSEYNFSDKLERLYMYGQLVGSWHTNPSIADESLIQDTSNKAKALKAELLEQISILKEAAGIKEAGYDEYNR